MKSQRAILVLVSFLALAAVLAWKFFPTQNTAPVAPQASPVKPATPKIAMLQKPTAVVELPKLAPAVPSNDPSATSDQTSLAPEPAAPPRPALNDTGTYYENTRDVTDFGEVYFTDGVPVELTMNSGAKCVITPTVLADGTLQLRLNIDDTSPDGRASRMNAGVVTRSGQNVSLVFGNYGGLKLTPRAN